MRNAFVQALTEAAARDPRIMLLTADLGYKIFDDFARRFPSRFMNVGIAEANMVGVATGLAMEGRKPFIYSIVPFVTLRAFEQVRNDICYHQADVTAVGVGGGYSYGPNGPTHHALEDIGAMRMLPGMTVVCPGDPAETSAAVQALAIHRGPAYLRLGRAGEPTVHQGSVSFQLGRGIQVRAGGDVALLSTGNMLAASVDTAALLAARGLGCRVLSLHTVKPLDAAMIEAAARETRLVVTLEEHFLAGGFGSACCDSGRPTASPIWPVTRPTIGRQTA
jgi:transketolase